MLILAINTASSFTNIALLEESILAEDSWQSSNDEAEKLMPHIAELLKKTGKDFSEIEKVLVIRGPGSFTGLRVGVTVANTISYLNKCELYGITTFEYWWTAAVEKIDETAQEEQAEQKAKKSALLIYAGRKGVYVNSKGRDHAEIINLYELNNYLKNKEIKTVFGDITEEQKAEISYSDFKELNMTFGKIIEKIPLNDLKPVKIVKPHYIKPPAITKSKKIIK
jgi:tRNA threonylcarbamoyl adenosine modification protein YeaZ